MSGESLSDLSQLKDVFRSNVETDLVEVAQSWYRGFVESVGSADLLEILRRRYAGAMDGLTNFPQEEQRVQILRDYSRAMKLRDDRKLTASQTNYLYRLDPGHGKRVEKADVVLDLVESVQKAVNRERLF